jgi:hypothetical protein
MQQLQQRARAKINIYIYIIYIKERWELIVLLYTYI